MLTPQAAALRPGMIRNTARISPVWTSTRQRTCSGFTPGADRARAGASWRLAVAKRPAQREPAAGQDTTQHQPPQPDKAAAPPAATAGEVAAATAAAGAAVVSGAASAGAAAAGAAAAAAGGAAAAAKGTTSVSSNGLTSVFSAPNSTEEELSSGSGSGSGSDEESSVSTGGMKSLFTASSVDFEGEQNSVEGSRSECKVFINRSGDMIPILCCDYGFRSGSGRMYQDSDGILPGSGFELGWQNFQKELEALRRSVRYDEYSRISKLNPAATLSTKVAYTLGSGIRKAFSSLDKTLQGAGVLKALEPEEPLPDGPATAEETKGTAGSSCDEVQTMLLKLTLSNKAVWDREHKREAAGDGVNTPLLVRAIYLSLCIFLDVFFDNRPIQRFWFLETVARMPYFSYISMLHLYESLGWWRAGAELRRVHFAEEWNELHHLQIMESLGGDQLWVDRFVAYHAAIIYYFLLVLLYFVAPKLAYNFSELIEAHAVDTYGEFADKNKKLLKKLPPPIVAAQYYTSADMYMFDEFQTSMTAGQRRPPCNNLYDVFCNIRDDEGEHVKTMAACQDMSVVEDLKERSNRGRRL